MRLSSVWGSKLRYQLFGESHGTCIGIAIDGLPAGVTLDFAPIAQAMQRRRSNPGEYGTTKRIEADVPEIQAGLHNGVTTGAPLVAMISNADHNSASYDDVKRVPRPGHADYPAICRNGESVDLRGSGHFSGRMTAPLVFAGALVNQLPGMEDIKAVSHIMRIGEVAEAGFSQVMLTEELILKLRSEGLPLLNEEIRQAIKDEIKSASQKGDSVGGIIECGILGIKPGVGNPFFDSLESTIAHLAFSIPAIKAIEFGAGFDCARMNGSQMNDAYVIDENGHVSTATNNNGGITGGISNGMPVVFRLAVKPTPSISCKQKSIDLKSGEAVEMSVAGRHDACIAARAAVVVESVALMAVYELLR